ncbi:MAG: acetyl-CoA synthase subunit gamma [Deltaproteobacteria bacterium]|nr:acetyl-CoA synthase subunit gamma [Deltaproteobacteria bacterium]
MSSALTLRDRAGAWLVRWGIGRLSYLVPAGLYALGNATSEDPVVVTANYKMSYDIVRNVLAGRRLWLLVLETYGVNVWCAAGKGTFGTDELVRRIEETALSQLIAHRRLIMPILGAPGIAAHEVRSRTGFEVRYATIRAGDLPEYLDNGMITTPGMRQLTFSLRERLVLIPVEIMLTLKPLAFIGFLLVSVPTLLGFPYTGLRMLAAFLAAAFIGIAVTPLLLPWLPGRYFSVKGAMAAVALLLAYYLFADSSAQNVFITLSTFLVLPAVSAFYALNFTGCTPFTSKSAVKKELRIVLPLMSGSFILGSILAIVGMYCQEFL